MILTGSKTFDHYLLWQVLFNTYGIKDHINGLNAACKKKKKNCDWEQYNMHNLCVNIFIFITHWQLLGRLQKEKKNGISDFQKSSQVWSINCNYLSKPLIIHR